MSINITYIASSGNRYDLMADQAIRTKDANYHKWSWGAVGTALQFGQSVTGFTRDPALYETRLMFRGTYAANKAQIEALHEDFELDMLSKSPGRIVWGEYYIDCYITASSTYPDASNRTVNDIEIFCPYPFWMKDIKRSFFIQSGTSETGLDYPYDYTYDYAHDLSGADSWSPGTALPSEYTMQVFGPVTDPMVTVGGVVIGVYDSIATGEYVTIDSRTHTVIKTGADGTETDLFDYRVKTSSIFDRIPGGNLEIQWSGLFGFDLTLHTERSEPR